MRRSNPVLDSRRDWIASLALAMTGASRTAVMPRACGASSTPRPIVSTTDVSGMLDRPLEPVIGLAIGETRWRTTTVENAAPSSPANVTIACRPSVATGPDRYTPASTPASRKIAENRKLFRGIKWSDLRVRSAGNIPAKNIENNPMQSSRATG